MNRGRSVGGGIVLAAIGVILAFAVQAKLSGIDLLLFGCILMVAGGCMLLLGLTVEACSGTQTEHGISADGWYEQIERRDC